MATIENFIVKVATQGVDQLSKLGQTADAVSGKMNALSGAILGVGFGAFVKGALESADRMVDLSDATGLSVASIKAFGESMRLAGGNSKGAERAIMGLYSAIEAAADGGLKQQEAFAKVGVSIQDLQNLSEADILQKTIEGLAKIPAGSERAAAATTLLGRSFRSVEAQRFLETLDPQAYLTFEQNAKKAADTMERFENLFATLQEGVLRALDPFLGYMEKIKFSAEDAERAFKIFGGILLVVFGAKMIASVVALNNALKITAGLSALLGKSPLGAVLKVGAGVAAGAGINELINQINELGEANDKLAESADTVGQTQGRLVSTTPPSGPANRTIKIAESETAKALRESRQRIEVIQAETDRIRQNMAEGTMSQIRNIELQATESLEKAKIEIYSKQHLQRSQMDEEFAAKRTEIELKAQLDIQKLREQAQKTLDDQVRAYSLSVASQERELILAKETASMRQADIDKRRAALAIEQQMLSAIEQARQVENAAPGALDETIARIKKEAEALKALSDANIEYQNSFEAGWRRAYASFLDNATNASKMAENMFSAFTSNMNSAIDNFVDNGKFSFSDLANSIIKDIIKIQLRAAVANIFNAGSNFLGFNLPGRAIGGPVMAGQPYMIGERGPEAFIPASAGTIISNDKLGLLGGGSTTVVNYNIQAVDAPSFRQMIARDPSFIYAVTEQGRKSVPSTRR